MLSIAADERAAMQFDELASLLDAGLPTSQLGARGGDGERTAIELLRRRDVRLSPSDEVVLAAAWRSGRVGPALRARAEQRRQRAAQRRNLLLHLLYPAALLGVAMLASLATAPVIGHYGFPIGLTVVLALLVAVALVLRRGLRRGDERCNRLPVVGRLVTDLAEIPYLETLQSLYGAGVPIVEAHANALAAVPNPALQRRLAVAGRVLGSGRTLTEALAEAVALHPDTRSLLAAGERAGTLEDALTRALQRRREVSQRGVALLLRSIAVGIYALAAAIAVALILSFWFSLYGQLRWR